MLFDPILLFRREFHSLMEEILTREMTMMLFNDDTFNDVHGDSIFYIRLLCDTPSIGV